MADQVKDLQWLQRLTWLFVGLGAIYIVGRAVPGIGRYFLPIYQEGATGSLFWVWLVALTFSSALVNQDLSKIVRVALLGIVIFIFYVALSSGRLWVSGWLPPIVTILAILWLENPRLALPGTLIGGVIVILNYLHSHQLSSAPTVHWGVPDAQ